jgi:hypothetical protein
VGDKPTIRIFVCSPGDVEAEREIASAAIAQLSVEFGYHCRLKEVAWEHEPTTADRSLQEGLPPPSDCDMMVAVVWSKLGSELNDTPDHRDPDDGHLLTGTEWEILDALRGREAGETDEGKPKLLVYWKKAPTFVQAGIDDEDDAQVWADFQDQRARLKAFMAKHFQDAEGRYTRAVREFRSAEAFKEQLTDHLRALLKETLATDRLVSTDVPVGNPFRGLASFNVADAPLFFGRAQARAEVHALLMNQVDRGRAAVLILGPSGSGKSSLAKAGLLADLQAESAVSPHRLIRHAIVRIGDAGGRPFRALAEALYNDALPELASDQLPGGRFQDADKLRNLLRHGPDRVGGRIGGALAVAARAVDKRPDGARLIVLLDQFEELLGEVGREEAEAFTALLTQLATSGVVWIAATLREDFLHRLDEIAGLRALFADGLYHLQPPGPDQISEMIRKPAALAGLDFERHPETGRSLAADLEEAVRADLHALPLLEFVLERLYEHRSDEGLLRFADYERMGKVAGAIARKAADATSDLSERDKAELNAILRALVTIDTPNAAPTATWVRRDEIETTATRTQLIDRLLSARLLVASTDRADGARTVRLAHEALIRSWADLKQVVEDNRQLLALRASLQPQVRDYQDSPETADLLGGFRLDTAKELLDKHGAEAFGRATAEFIEASARYRDQKKAEADQQLQELIEKNKQLEEQTRRAEEAREKAEREKAERLQAQQDVLRHTEQKRELYRWGAGVVSALLLVSLVFGGWVYAEKQTANARLEAQQAAMSGWADAWQAFEQHNYEEGLNKLEDARKHANAGVLTKPTREVLLYEIGYTYYRLARQHPDQADREKMYKAALAAYDTANQLGQTGSRASGQDDRLPLSPRRMADLADLLQTWAGIRTSHAADGGAPDDPELTVAELRAEAIAKSGRAASLRARALDLDPGVLDNPEPIASSYRTQAKLYGRADQAEDAVAAYWKAVGVYRAWAKDAGPSEGLKAHRELVQALADYRAFAARQLAPAASDPNADAAVEDLRSVKGFIEDAAPADPLLVYDAARSAIDLRAYALARALVDVAEANGTTLAADQGQDAGSQSVQRNTAIMRAKLARAHAALLDGDTEDARWLYRTFLSGHGPAGTRVRREVLLKTLEDHAERNAGLSRDTVAEVKRLARGIAGADPGGRQVANTRPTGAQAPEDGPDTPGNVGPDRQSPAADDEGPAPSGREPGGSGQSPDSRVTAEEPERATAGDGDIEEAIEAARDPLSELMPFQRVRLENDLKNGRSVSEAVDYAFSRAPPAAKREAEDILCKHLPSRCE